MATINVRTLSHRTGDVLNDVAETGRPAIVTSGGRPVAALVPLPPEVLEDWALANVPEFVADMDRAEREVRSGRRGQSVADVFAELDAEPTPAAKKASATPAPPRRRSRSRQPT